MCGSQKLRRYSEGVHPMRQMAVVILTLLALCESSVAIEPASRPNVLFIVCDDLNTHVSTSGYPHIRTPAFDELAAAGMTFRRAYCQYPLCNLWNHSYG